MSVDVQLYHPSAKLPKHPHDKSHRLPITPASASPQRHSTSSTPSHLPQTLRRRRDGGVREGRRPPQRRRRHYPRPPPGAQRHESRFAISAIFARFGFAHFLFGAGMIGVDCGIGFLCGGCGFDRVCGGEIGMC